MKKLKTFVIHFIRRKVLYRPHDWYLLVAFCDLYFPILSLNKVYLFFKTFPLAAILLNDKVTVVKRIVWSRYKSSYSINNTLHTVQVIH